MNEEVICTSVEYDWGIHKRLYIDGEEKQRPVWLTTQKDKTCAKERTCNMNLIGEKTPDGRCIDEKEIQNRLHDRCL